MIWSKVVNKIYLRYTYRYLITGPFLTTDLQPPFCQPLYFFALITYSDRLFQVLTTRFVKNVYAFLHFERCWKSVLLWLWVVPLLLNCNWGNRVYMFSDKCQTWFRVTITLHWFLFSWTLIVSLLFSSTIDNSLTTLAYTLPFNLFIYNAVHGPVW